MSTFLSHFLEHTKPYESPNSFWLWAALSSISAVLRDSCHALDGEFKLYPNIYCLFLANSAARKGRPINLAEDLVRHVNNTKIISGRSSIQAILDELAHTETNPNTGQIIKGGAAIFFAPELSAGLVEDSAATGILTDIYDGKTNFSHHLRHSPKFKVDRIVFTAFMASNESLIRGVFDQRATQGGLLGRTFLIVPDEVRNPNSLMRHKTDFQSFDELKAKLKEVAKLAGEFQFEEDAIVEYERWYEPFYLANARRGDKSGITGRVHTGVKKVAMLLAANEGTTIIGKCHIEHAITLCVSLIPNYNNFVLSSGKSTIAEAGSILVADLFKHEGGLTRAEILRDHWQDFDPETLDRLTATLETAGMIGIVDLGQRGLGYILTKKGLELLKS